MSLISRSVLREIWPPFLLGFSAYTFILLVRTIYFLADFFVRRSATLGEVVWLVVLSLPWIIVLTLPMAFLLGVLIGIGRLSADSEVIALRACGVGPAAIARPALWAALFLAGVVFVCYNLVLPQANDTLTRSLARVAATSVVNVVQPRTFREVRPGLTLFFDRSAADGRSLEGVFLQVGEEEKSQVIVARRGTLNLEGDHLWLDLVSSTLHDFNPADPSRYRTNRNETQRILLAGDVGNPASTRVSFDKALRSQSLSELLASVRKSPRLPPEQYRLAWVEIHKKLSIPFACLAFAIVGIPLAETSRRGGKGSGFAMSLAIIVLYYVLLSSGETWAQEGRLAPGLAIWLPNVVLLGLGAAAMIRGGRDRGRWRFPWRKRSLEDKAGPAARVETAPRSMFSGVLRFPTLLDRYVLARFLSVFFLVAASVLLLAVMVDYTEHIDKIATNRPSAEVVLGYYRNFLLTISLQIAPFAILLSALIALGILSRNNEDTAFRANGVSLHRLGAPIVVVSFLAAGLAFAAGEYVLPKAQREQAQYKNLIYGRPVDYGLSTPTERRWHYGPGRSIWHQEASDPEKGILISPSVFQFSDAFEVIRRDIAREAAWDGHSWVLRQGWSRTFGSSEASYRTYLEERLPGDPPTAFTRARRGADEMRFRELQRYARRLKASGYPTGVLDTALQAKLATPLLIPLMALLAVPFAFRIGKKGTLAGIGVGLALGMAFLIAGTFFTKVGEVGALPAVLAAWSPNVLAATAAAWLMLRLRT